MDFIDIEFYEKGDYIINKNSIESISEQGDYTEITLTSGFKGLVKLPSREVLLYELGITDQ